MKIEIDRVEAIAIVTELTGAKYRYIEMYKQYRCDKDIAWYYLGKSIEISMLIKKIQEGGK